MASSQNERRPSRTIMIPESMRRRRESATIVIPDSMRRFPAVAPLTDRMELRQRTSPMVKAVVTFMALSTIVIASLVFWPSQKQLERQRITPLSGETAVTPMTSSLCSGYISTARDFERILNSSEYRIANTQDDYALSMERMRIIGRFSESSHRALELSILMELTELRTEAAELAYRADTSYGGVADPGYYELAAGIAQEYGLGEDMIRSAAMKAFDRYIHLSNEDTRGKGAKTEFRKKANTVKREFGL
ncbi:MAG: hypothetical protein ABIG39_05720 [Candidatus Micrarchaeota archaeon]